MTDMLTAVARAICEADGVCMARCTTEGCRGYHAAARAAIRALMEPTKEMLMDGNEIISYQCDVWIPSDGVDYSAPPCANDVFQAMLRRALGEE